MYNIKRQISVYLQRALLVGFIGIAFQLFSCMPEFDNPVSFNYQGDYKLTQNNTFSDTTSLEILKTYKISFQSSGADKYWKIYVSSPSSHLLSDTVRGDTLPGSNGSTIFLFNSPCTTSIDLIGLRPNRICDTVHLNKDLSQVNKKGFYVFNPYFIDGKKTSEVDDSVTLKIMRHDQAQIPSYIQPINWSILTAFKSSEIQGESLHVSNSQRGILSSNATLKVIFCSVAYTYTIDTFKVDFPGTAPIVDSFKVIGTLGLGVPATFSFRCVDPDPDPLRYIISADNDTLLDTIIEHTSGRYVNTKPIADTSYSIIRLKVIDSTGFEARDSITDPTINFENPEILFGNYDTVPMNDPIYILCTGKADFYHWRYRNNPDLTTNGSSITLPPYTNTLSDTIYVYGENIFYFKNDTIRVIGKTDIIILKPTYSEYTVKQSNILPFIKTKQWDSIIVFTKHNDTIISDSTLRFEWSVNGSSASLVEFKTFGPKINFFLTDTLPYFSVSVKIYDSTHLLTNWNKTILIRVFSPTFAFKKDTIKDSVLTYNLLYSASDDTSYPGAKVDSIYLKQIGGPSGDTSTQKFTSQQETTLTFNSSGTYKIVGWAIDNESNASPKDTIILNLTTHKPEFDSTNVSKTLSLGDTAKLKAQLKSDSNIIKYYWDTNNDGKWDDSISGKVKNITFPKDTTYIIQAQCRNSSGDTAISRMYFNVQVNKNEPTFDTFTISKDSTFINTPIEFKIKGKDPDSNLTEIVVYAISTSKTILLDSMPYPIETSAVERIFRDSTLSAGNYTITAFLKDKKGNRIGKTISLTIDQGMPIIDSIVFVNDIQDIKTNCPIRFYAHDPDGLIDSIYLYSELDSIIGKIKLQPNLKVLNSYFVSSPIFNNGGTYIRKASVMDNSRNLSLVSKSVRSIYIEQGIPTIDSVSKISPYINDDVTITIYATDKPVNTGLKYSISNNDTNSFTVPTLSDSLTTRFSKSGWNYLYIRVIDNQGQVANRMDSVFVKRGTPVINSITFTPQPVYVNDLIKFNISATDSNDYIDTVYADINGDLITDMIAARVVSGNDSLFQFSKRFPVDSAGTRSISFWAIDNDRISSDTSEETITIHEGAPKFISWSSDSTRLWGSDYIPFNFLCSDTNGTIKRIIINWGDDSTTDISVNATTHEDIIKTGHKFTITKDTTFQISIQLTDDDAITKSFIDSIRVLKGMPEVWISGSEDTLFARIANSAGTCTLSVSSKDSNDATLNYYWKINSTSLDTTGSQHTTVPWKTLEIVGDASVNNFFGNERSAVFVKDPDGNMAGDTFHIYLDGPPPAPMIVYPISTTSAFGINDTITFEWFGTDVHDSVTTQYKLSTNPPGDLTPWKDITTFISGSQLTTEIVGGIIHFKYKYFPTDGQGTYQWKVEAQDRSGSITVSNAPESFYHN